MNSTGARSRLTLAGLVLALVILGMFNSWYWLWRSAAGPHLVQPDLVSPAETMSDQNMVDQMRGMSLWWIALLPAIIVAATVVWWWLNRLQAKAKLQRDATRRQALVELQQGLAAYAAQVGHYPTGSLQQRQVPAVGLGYEWDKLGFPSEMELKPFLPHWPVVDPLVSYDEHKQYSQYLYYPQNDGQGYILYAHLETAAKDAPDYNRLAGLPRAWGEYNYAVSGGVAEAAK